MSYTTDIIAARARWDSTNEAVHAAYRRMREIYEGEDDNDVAYNAAHAFFSIAYDAFADARENVRSILQLDGQID